MVVVAVGVHSVKGRITGLMTDSAEEAEETLLQKKLTYIAELIGKVITLIPNRMFHCVSY